MARYYEMYGFTYKNVQKQNDSISNQKKSKIFLCPGVLLVKLCPILQMEVNEVLWHFYKVLKRVCTYRKRLQQFSNHKYKGNFQRMIPLKYITIQPVIDEVVTPPNESIEDNPYEKVIGLKDFDSKQNVGFGLETKRISNNKIKKVNDISIVKLKLAAA